MPQNPPRDLDGSGRFLDIDGDGTVNIMDTQLLLEEVDSEIADHFGLFDYNGDGDLNVIDVSIHLDQY